jgi:acetyl-CoA hydrolase
LLHEELESGRLPHDFLPPQSGVGNVANAVMHGIGAHTEIPNFMMCSEVFQSAPFELMRRGRLLGASTCAMTLSPRR